MGARKKKVRKAAKRGGKALRRAAGKAIKNLGGPKKLRKGARQVAEAAADALVDAITATRKKKKK